MSYTSADEPVLWVQYLQRDDEQNQGGPIFDHSYVERNRERQDRTERSTGIQRNLSARSTFTRTAMAPIQTASSSTASVSGITSLNSRALSPATYAERCQYQVLSFRLLKADQN
jgi:hypothetical protein